MSRAYRISVSESVRRHVRVSDGIRTELDILDVLPAPAMCDLLAAELATRGFQRSGDTMTRTDEDGVEISIGVAGDNAGRVKVSLAREKLVDIRIERSMRTYEEKAEEDQEMLRRELERDITRREAAEHAELSAEVTAVLERKLRDLGRELGQIGNRVTAEALKVRARQLGEVREISEDAETGSITIKVRV